jgi:ubiquitin carboxyl-terminal hydrolase L3
MSALADPWLPVESNPQVFNDFAKKLGWPVSRFVFQDLLSTEEWGLAMVPTPCLAVAMLYEINEAQEAHRAAEEVTRAAQTIPPASLPFFMTQTIPNACGTIALIHACANLSKEGGGDVELPPDSWLAKYTKAALPLSPLERVELIAKDETLAAQHAEVVQQGQSEVVDDTHQHFVLFLEKGGRLWELDGRKGGPIDCGPSSPLTLLQDSCAAVTKYMSRNPESLRFTM